MKELNEYQSKLKVEGESIADPLIRSKDGKERSI